MESRKFYAVERDCFDNDWNYGSFDFEEAKNMLKDNDWTAGKIAVIEIWPDEANCIEEYNYSDLF
jgi:hypothetical protein